MPQNSARDKPSLFTAGPGGVGHMAIQIAKARGARVIATASTANQDFLKKLGADQAIDYTKTKFEDVVKDVDVVLDAVGGDTLTRSYDVVKKGGVIVTIAGGPDQAALDAHGIRGVSISSAPSGAPCRTHPLNRRQKTDASRDAGLSPFGSGQSSRPDRDTPHPRQNRAAGGADLNPDDQGNTNYTAALTGVGPGREPRHRLRQTSVRARALGIPFDGTPGKLNAITDVAGVEVGFTTLISGEGKLEVGEGPVRTGVTAVISRGHDSLNDPVYAGTFSLNGNGEMTGMAWVEESGFLEGPVVITNTHSVGVARDAVIAWRLGTARPTKPAIGGACRSSPRLGTGG